MTAKIDCSSLTASIGGESPQLMLYGFDDCKYTDITSTLLKPDAFGPEAVENPIKRVFSHTIGNIYLNETPETAFTLEGRKFHKIKRPDRMASICKAALVNIIIENVKRNREDLLLIPILFTIDISTDTSGFYPPTISDVITNKNQYTLKELRRVYKLCTDTSLPEEVREVANRTFKFVKVLVSNSSTHVIRESATAALGVPTFAFESIKAPWQQEPRENWDRALAEYRDKKKAIPPSKLKLSRLLEKEAKGWHWRPQLLKAIGAPSILDESDI